MNRVNTRGLLPVVREKKGVGVALAMSTGFISSSVGNSSSKAYLATNRSSQVTLDVESDKSSDDVSLRVSAYLHAENSRDGNSHRDSSDCGDRRKAALHESSFGSERVAKNLPTGEEQEGLVPECDSFDEGDCIDSVVSKRQIPKVLHRVAVVREQQGVSHRTMGRRLGIEVKRYREMENPEYDLSLSELHAIQQALDVPMIDLLEDSHTLSRPVAERAKLLKIMKTAVALREQNTTKSVHLTATMLTEQLVDLMPELKDVSGWPQFGVRRGTDTLGRAGHNTIDSSKLDF